MEDDIRFKPMWYVFSAFLGSIIIILSGFFVSSWVLPTVVSVILYFCSYVIFFLNRRKIDHALFKNLDKLANSAANVIREEMEKTLQEKEDFLLKKEKNLSSREKDLQERENQALLQSSKLESSKKTQEVVIPDTEKAEFFQLASISLKQRLL